MFQPPQDHSYLVELQAGVLRLSFNRPSHGNAIPPATIPQLAELLREAQACAQVRCILVRGEGKNLSAGGDLENFAQAIQQGVPALQQEFTRRMANLRGLTEAYVGFDRPIVVAMRGAAVGAGLLYPLAADYVISDSTALFAFSHRLIGLSPDNGVTALLPQSVGLRKARTLLLTAARVKAEEALSLGLVDEIVANEKLEEAALALAQRFASAPQRATQLTKQLVNAAPRRDFTEHLLAEGAGIVNCVGDADFAEGVHAFLEKRSPRFPSAQ